jgi:hypothetical protein
MIQISQESLKPLASRYIWWKTPQEAMVMPERVVAQVMNICIGDYSDAGVASACKRGCVRWINASSPASWLTSPGGPPSWKAAVVGADADLSPMPIGD